MFLQQIPFKHKTTWTGTPALLLSTLALSLSLLVSYSLCYSSRINQCLWQSPEVDGFHEGANVCCAAARVGAGLRSI